MGAYRNNPLPPEVEEHKHGRSLARERTERFLKHVSTSNYTLGALMEACYLTGLMDASQVFAVSVKDKDAVTKIGERQDG